MQLKRLQITHDAKTNRLYIVYVYKSVKHRLYAKGGICSFCENVGKITKRVGIYFKINLVFSTGWSCLKLNPAVH